MSNASTYVKNEIRRANWFAIHLHLTNVETIACMQTNFTQL